MANAEARLTSAMPPRNWRLLTARDWGEAPAGTATFLFEKNFWVAVMIQLRCRASLMTVRESVKIAEKM